MNFFSKYIFSALYTSHTSLRIVFTFCGAVSFFFSHDLLHNGDLQLIIIIIIIIIKIIIIKKIIIIRIIIITRRLYFIEVSN